MIPKIHATSPRRHSARQTRTYPYFSLCAGFILALLSASLFITQRSHAQATDKEPSCQFTLSDTFIAFPREGGIGKVSFEPNIENCAWEASTKDDFITILTKASGDGPGVIAYEVAPSPDDSTRKGAISVAGQTLTIVQGDLAQAPAPQRSLNSPPEPAGCVTGLSPAEFDALPAGATATVSVDAPDDCFWTAKSNAPWLTPDTNANSGKGKGEATFTVAPNAQPTARISALDIGGQELIVTQNSPLNLPVIEFKFAGYAVQEGETARLTVIREGDTSQASSVAYATHDNFAWADCAAAGAANQRCDYAVTRGTLVFQPGETEKSFELLITADAYPEADESITVALGNTANANFGGQRTASLTLHDNGGSGQPLEDPNFFVTQHYTDFLSRKPDADGFAYWVGELTACTNAACLSTRRVGVSNAFFYEQEFQQTGAFVYRLYRAAFGVTRPAYREFVADRAQIANWPDLAAGKTALADDFANRPEFLARYPATLTGAEFIASILHNIQKDSRVDLSSQTPVLLSLYELGGPALVLRELADQRPDNLINNQAWLDAEYNPSFVLTQYFGYLRRDPDASGYGFWLNVLNNYPLRDLTGQHAMVCAFITSAEYQRRFGPDVPRDNSECPN